MKKASLGRNLDSNLEMMIIWKCCLLIYSFKLYICQDPRTARAYTSKIQKKRTSRLSRSASIRVHVEVRNGYGGARGVRAAPRRRRSNEALWPRIPVRRIAYWGRDEKKLLAESPKKRMIVYCSLYMISQLECILIFIIYIIYIYVVMDSFCLNFRRKWG